jgi:hypothetical protein
LADDTDELPIRTDHRRPVDSRLLEQVGEIRQRDVLSDRHDLPLHQVPRQHEVVLPFGHDPPLLASST